MINFLYMSDPDILMSAFGIFIIFTVATIIGKWNLFRRAGYDGWASLIPIYSDYIYTKVAGVSILYFFLLIAMNYFWLSDLIMGNHSSKGDLLLICLVVWKIGLFFCNYNISRKIHKGMGFAILMTLFSYVMIPLVGLLNFKLDDEVMISLHGPFGEKRKVSKSIINEEKGYRYCSSCGARVKADSKFCGKCGKEI
ncbi:MAG: zinc ribbon domain-containing protein [Bacilli bacterium]|nr:zinc ribbon domain-containing protein [Bacilli bacterium]